MKKIKTILSLFLLMVCSFSWAQTIQVTGKVTDANDGQALPGAYVLIKGGGGFITDNDGNFSLSCPNDAVLIVSFVGYQDQEVSVNGRAVINVALTHANVLDEVVVSALGIARDKKSMGHAIQEVKSDELTRAGQINVASALSGKVAGLQVTAAGGQVGASSRFVIRGNSSLGNNEPLFVVDGIPISNDQYVYGDVDLGSGLMDLNPDDIESITVLKGGAGALYGMRAGNGVILITTKSGKKNREGISISYDGSFTFDQMYGLPKFQNKYGQGYYGSEWDYNNEKDGGYTGSYADFVKDMCFSIDGIDKNADESWGPRLDIGLMVPQFDSPVVNGVHQATPWVSHPDNVSSFFQTGYSMNHNVSALIRTEKTNTRASLSFRDTQGTVPNTDQKRYTAQINSNFDINKYLSFNLTMNYTHTESDNLPSTAYQAGNPMQSMLEWFGRQVDMKSLKARWNEVDETTGKPFNWNPDYHQNPYYTVYKNTNSFDRNRVFGKTSLFLKVTDWLKIEGRLGYDYYDSQAFQKVAYNTDYPDGGFWQFSQKNSELNADILAMFNKTFGEDVFNISAILGANFRNSKYQNNVLGAEALTVPELYTISNVNGSPITSMDHSHIRTNSVYASLSLGFKGMLYLDASARNDWSSTIKDPFFYPSVSLSWIPTQTFEALKGSVLNYLKIRGGWAKIGSATSAYKTGSYYNAVSSSFRGVSQFMLPTEFPPAGLRPESVQTWEAGLELQMFKSRLGLDVSLYSKKTTDQILAVEVSRSTGYSTMLVNAGEFRNKGIEVQLTGRPIETKDWKWDIILNWSKDISRIESLYSDPTTGQELKTYTIGSEWSTYVYAKAPLKDENGKIEKYYSWGTIYGYGNVTDEKGNVIVNSKGLPKRELKDMGSVTPNWLASFRTELTWKDLSFGFMLDYRNGGKFFSVTSMWGQYTGILEMTAANNVREEGVVFGKNAYTGFNFVKEDGSANDIVVGANSAFANSYQNREYAVADGSFLKLREMHLTYTLPAKLFKKSSIVKGFNVSFIANNVATLWLHPSNLARIDPETSKSSSNSGVGLETGSYMPTRSMGIKVGLTF